MSQNTDYLSTHDRLKAGFRSLQHAIPEQMAGFGSMHAAAVADGALSTKVKELMALAIGITSQCDGCIAFHVHDALRAGATRAEIEETIGVALLMGGGPAAVYGTEALAALDQFEAESN
ncbi:MAG: carboxymuconolactone decarboxylase family protein [Actinomycetota bacterium]